jgi:hypothetical protein
MQQVVYWLAVINLVENFCLETLDTMCVLYMDIRLDMRVHISKIASICFFHLRKLRHLRLHTVDRDTRQHLVSALILSRIDYCNVLFAG